MRIINEEGGRLRCGALGWCTLPLSPRALKFNYVGLWSSIGIIAATLFYFAAKISTFPLDRCVHAYTSGYVHEVPARECCAYPELTRPDADADGCRPEWKVRAYIPTLYTYSTYVRITRDFTFTVTVCSVSEYVTVPVPVCTCTYGPRNSKIRTALGRYLAFASVLTRVHRRAMTAVWGNSGPGFYLDEAVSIFRNLPSTRGGQILWNHLPWNFRNTSPL